LKSASVKLSIVLTAILPLSPQPGLSAGP
jgi:hypothetical protein